MQSARGTARLLAFVCLAGLLSWQRVSALCPAEQSRYVLLHAVAQGSSWDSLLSATDVVVPDTVCALSPGRVSVAAAYPTTWAVFATQSGALYLADITWQRAPSFCGKPSLTVGTPRKLPVSAPGMPFCVINHPQFRSDAVLVAVGVAPAMVQVYTIATVNGGITGISMVTPVAANAAQSVTGIFGDAGTRGGDDHGMWLAGPGGLVRHVAFDGAAWGAEVSADIDSAQTLGVLADGVAGTLQGHIYTVTGNVLVYQSRPTTQPLLGISQRCAVGGAGTVLVRQGTAWQSYSIGATAYRHGNAVALPAGSSVELLDTAWNYTVLTYRDTATAFSSFDPDTVGLYVNAGPCYIESGTVVIGLSDADSNIVLPSVSLHRESGGTISLLASPAGDTLGPALPHEPSFAGGLQLADTVVVLDLTAGSAALRAPVLRAAVIPGCTTTYWAPDTFEYAVSRSQHDTLVVAVGGDTLRIVGGHATVTTGPQHALQAPSHAVRVRDRGGREFSVPLETGGAVVLSIFDASGRLVGRHAVPAGQAAVQLPFVLPRELLVVRAAVAGTGSRTIRYTLLP